jgi:hypothetical protein
MLLQPYFLETYVRQYQADLLAEAAREATASEFLRAQRAKVAARVQRTVRIVRTTPWVWRRASLAMRTDMTA